MRPGGFGEIESILYAVDRGMQAGIKIQRYVNLLGRKMVEVLENGVSTVILENMPFWHIV